MTLPAEITHNLTFDDIIRQAEVLGQSRIIPQAYRNRAPDIVAAGLAGTAFGWDVMTSLRNYHVIEGAASLRPEAMLGLVRRSGHSVLISFTVDQNGNRIASAYGKRLDSGDEHTATFSTENAKAAGLANKKNWQQYEEAMLTWRAVSILCRVLFPDVVLGAGYTPEEIGGTVTAEGVPEQSDPLAEEIVRSVEAKNLLIEACDGDKEQAREIWGDRGNNGIPMSELDLLIQKALEADIIEAEVLPTEMPAPEARHEQSHVSESNLERVETTLKHLSAAFGNDIEEEDF